MLAGSAGMAVRDRQYLDELSQFMFPPCLEDQQAAEYGPFATVNASECACDSCFVVLRTHPLVRVPFLTRSPVPSSCIHSCRVLLGTCRRVEGTENADVPCSGTVV